MNESMDYCVKRISELSQLQNGWHDGNGLAITSQAVETANKVMNLNHEMNNHYSIFPTDEGGLLIEFIREKWDYSIEIHQDGKLEIYGTEILGKKDMSTDLMDFDCEFLKHFKAITGMQVAYHPSEMPEHIKKALRETKMSEEHNHLNSLLD